MEMNEEEFECKKSNMPNSRLFIHRKRQGIQQKDGATEFTHFDYTEAKNLSIRDLEFYIPPKSFR
jgi:hypothetical protein